MAGLFGRSRNEGGAQGAGQAVEGAAATEKNGSLIKDATTASFSADVLAESARQPVLVDFWAPWCGPCKQLAPVLEKAVKAAGGKVKLVKMNIDEHPDIPGRLGVRSIPAVIAFQRGQPVDGFMGALPEREVKGFIERLAGPIADDADRLAEAEALVAAGDVEGASDLYTALLAENSGDPAAVAGLAKLFVSAGDIESAKKVLVSVAPGGERDAAFIAAKAALDLAEQAADVGDSSELTQRIAANPDDHQARLDFATLLNAKNRREEAAAELLEVIKRDRAWNDDGARKQLLQFFDAWGPADPATIGARKKLSLLLFS
ncbi:thioredoxin [Methylocapsa sp. D3K7]|uniref:thioredoxin n=1 Tax=Methylocapsa sp. D3K7 TaxID=3041435 RepID=UPI00244EFD94|nr:thioredoxin [Methylocapsa sp. D3K7]WGJ13679.1 thioredoxin [Methylocapsa sp. D3K7]